MSPKLSRLLFVALVVTGVSAPMLGAYGAPRRSSVDAFNPPKGFVVPGAPDPKVLEININDTVTWNIMDGEHTITPQNPQQWGDDGSDTLKQADSGTYIADNFNTKGDYGYYCKLHENMSGIIRVIDPTPTTQPPPATQPPTTQPPTTQPPTTQPPTTQPSAAPPATTATAPTTRPTPTTAAPTTTTAKADKDKKGNKDETTTTTMPPLTPPPPPIDLPDEAIVPHLPGPGSTVQGGVEDPGSAAEGEAVALLTPGKGGSGNAKTLLIVSGLGLGVLGLGTAGYKWANRSSKYFPA